MVFSNLAGRLQETLRQLRGKGKLTEKDVDEALREVKLALLEADVNFRVVRGFINRVRERAVGKEVTSSLTPGQMVVKIVHQELTALMGEKEEKIRVAPQPDRKSTRLNSSHVRISYAVFCLKKKKKK